MEWKTIEVNKKYEISDTGLVRNAETKHVMYQGPNTAGYLRVNLGCPPKKYFVHRLLAMAFIPGYFEGAVVNHKDLNRTNNTVENLEWVTLKENSRHAFNLGRYTGCFKPQIRNIKYKDKIYTKITVSKFCKLQGICKTTFYNYCKKGKVSYVSND